MSRPCALLPLPATTRAGTSPSAVAGLLPARTGAGTRGPTRCRQLRVDVVTWLSASSGQAWHHRLDRAPRLPIDAPMHVTMLLSDEMKEKRGPGPGASDLQLTFPATRPYSA